MAGGQLATGGGLWNDCRHMKALKWVGIVLAVVVVIAGLGIVGLKLKGPKARPAPDLKIEATAERVARGKYLADTVMACAHCHSEGQMDLWGVPPKPERYGAGVCHTGPMAEAFPGKLCVPNITSHATAGIGGWTDGELLRAIREGIGRDGHALFPMMPYANYKALSDEDAHSVIAYLRTLPPHANQVAPFEVDFPLSLLIQFGPEPVETVSEPNRQDSVAYGRYLSTIGGCEHCHTPTNEQHQPIPELAFSGGQEFPLGTHVVRSANITFHPTGLGERSKEDFIAGFRMWSGEAARKQKIDPAQNTIMPWVSYSEMTDGDLGAIYDYLRTVKPVDHTVERFSPVAQAN